MYTPGPATYQEVKGRFVLNGDTLNAYCTRNGLRRQNVRDALLGVRNGPKAKALARQVIAASRGDDA
jgi:hypothetical protein